MSLARAAVIASLLALAVSACGDDEPEPPPPEGSGEDEVREIWLHSAPVEGSQPELFAAPQPSLTDAIRRLGAVERDETAKGLFLVVGPLEGAWGRNADVREAIARVRATGKPVHCHFDVTDNAGYALMASSCDRISMTPAGHLELVGVAAHLFFAKTLLDNVGLRAEMMQMGRYKGAAEPFTRDTMSEATRESIGALLDDLTESLIGMIAEGRNLSRDRVRAVLDEGPYRAWDAKRAGLVDDVGFDDEAREHARVAAGVERVTRVELRERPEPMSLVDLLAALGGESPETLPEGERIALVHLEGNIIDAEETGVDGARSGPFVRAMRSFARDDDVKAVVLRIDSPGGSALASDRMWHAVRHLASKKPVVVSVGDMAASGGYYVACAGTEILAHEDSIVGSIGVVGGKIVARDLLDRIGVNVEIIARGENAAWWSPVREFDEAERAVVQRMLRSTYRRFLSRVADSREMEPAAVEAAAEGRIHSGRRAKELGLIDDYGSLSDALDRARELGGVSRWAPVERWPRPKSLIEAIAEGFGGSPGDRRVTGLFRELLHAAGPLAEAAFAVPLLLGEERVAVALPYVIDVR